MKVAVERLRTEDMGIVTGDTEVSLMRTDSKNESQTTGTGKWEVWAWGRLGNQEHSLGCCKFKVSVIQGRLQRGSQYINHKQL